MQYLTDFSHEVINQCLYVSIILYFRHLIVTCAEDGSINLWWPKMIGPLTVTPTNNLTWFNRGQGYAFYNFLFSGIQQLLPKKK